MQMNFSCCRAWTQETDPEDSNYVVPIQCTAFYLCLLIQIFLIENDIKSKTVHGNKFKWLGMKKKKKAQSPDNQPLHIINYINIPQQHIGV